MLIFIAVSFMQKSARYLQNTSQPVPTSFQNEKTYSSSLISFSKPEKAIVDSAPIEGGGNSVIVHLSGATSTSDIIEIQMTPVSLTPIQRIYDIMSAFGLRKNSATVGAQNIPAVEFKGSMNLGGKTLQQDVVVFEKNGNVYKFQMMYSAPFTNPSFESQFQRVLSTTSI